MGGEVQVMVEQDGKRLRLWPGDTIGGWQLLRVASSYAIFRDTEGAERVLPLGLQEGALGP
jgi:hypothetical protein